MVKMELGASIIEIVSANYLLHYTSSFKVLTSLIIKCFTCLLYKNESRNCQYFTKVSAASIYLSSFRIRNKDKKYSGKGISGLQIFTCNLSQTSKWISLNVMKIPATYSEAWKTPKMEIASS